MRKEFVATGFIVNGDKTLLVHHKKLEKWLPVGGHIEKEETPEQALEREAMEEAGLTIEILEQKHFENEDSARLKVPHYMQVELIPDKQKGLHEHIDLIFFCKTKENKITLNKKEHHDIKWFTAKDLENEEIMPNVRILGKKAIETANKHQSEKNVA